MPEPSFRDVERIFHDALALPTADRHDFLDRACGDDADLRAEIAALLEATDETIDSAFLESPGGAVVEAASADDPPRDATADAGPSARLGPGTRIAHFTLVRQIGAGGMGAVYEARQDQPRRRVALKVIRTGLPTAAALRRFSQEAEILASLTHPGIAQVYEVGTHDDGTGPLPWFAMELIEGARDLRSHADHERLDLEGRLDLFRAVCEAVEYGHRAGVVHRDLKPDNILVDQAGRPKIIDFGVARATGGDIAATTIETRTGQIVGTLQYMSPEQWRADPSAIDARADVYALGTVLYELLSGSLPHDLSRAALHEAGRIVMDEPPRRPSTFDRTLSGDIETIILKSLEKERERRYASAGALGEDIARYLRREPIEARPPSTWYQLRLFARRNRSLVTAVVATLVILTAATIASTIFAVNAHRARVDAQERAAAEKRARREAETLFQKGRALTRWVVTDFIDQIADVPGNTKAERELTEKVIEYLDGLDVTGATDPDFRREVGLGYLQLGEVLGNPYRDNVGRSDQARAAYERALDIFDTLSRSDDRTLHDDWRRATVERLLGHQDHIAGNPAGAIARYRRAESILRPLLREASQKSRALLEDDLGSLSDDLAWRLRATGQLAEAKRIFLANLATRRSALARDPDNPPLIRSVAISESFAATVLGDLGEYDEALDHANALLALVKPSVAKEIGSGQAKRDLASAYSQTGDVFTLRGRYDRAMTCFERACAIREALARANPESVLAQTDFALSLERIADIETAQSDHESALERRHRAHRIVSSALEKQPTNRLLRRKVWISAAKLATAYLLLKKLEPARKHAEASLRVARGLTEEDPRSMIDHQGVAEALTNLGSICTMSPEAERSSEPFRRAVRHYRAAEKAWAAVEAIGELSETQKRSRAASHSMLEALEGALRKLGGR